MALGEENCISVLIRSLVSFVVICRNSFTWHAPAHLTLPVFPGSKADRYERSEISVALLCYVPKPQGQGRGKISPPLLILNFPADQF